MTSQSDFLDNLYDALVTVEMKNYVKGKRNIIQYLYCLNTSGNVVKMFIKRR